MNFVGYQYQMDRKPYTDEENVGDNDDELTD